MKLKNNELSLKNGIKKEWIITNGIGGYASSTILGTNTRKYHGLLVASLASPGRRFLVLSKVNEDLEIGESQYNLHTNICKDNISTGYKYMDEFEKDYVPTFKYSLKDIYIEKSICMKYGENTVTLLYNIKNKSKENVKLILTPLLNFRDFHTITSGHTFNIRQRNKDNRVRVVIDDEIQNPIYMNCTEGVYIQSSNNRFNDMYYKEEESRGFYPEENHAVPGSYEISVLPGEEKDITFVCSLKRNIEKIDARKIILKEQQRIDNIIRDLKIEYDEEILKQYAIATDNFIVHRSDFKLDTLIAGYPWFLDIGRNSLTSLEGISLISGRFDIAKQVILTLIKDEKNGLVPNGYSGFNSKPLYNSVDCGLLLFEQIKKYIKYTNDYKFVKGKIYNTMARIIKSYKEGIKTEDINIYLDKDFLLESGTKYNPLTWMDAKIGKKSVTPRNGKPVEVNALWYNALKIMEELSKKIGEEESAKKYSLLARRCKKSFKEKFYNEKKQCLNDVVGDDKIRPNQLFALSLSYPVLESKSFEAKQVFNTVTKKLLNDYGLKTLAKGEELYKDKYEGDETKRDISYHQGITWPWLLGLYYDAFKNIMKSEKDEKELKIIEEDYNKFIQKTRKTFIKEINQGKTIGNIPEIYDSKRPFKARGAIADCRSVAEVFRIIFMV